MTAESATRFAAGWVEAWNRRDVEAVLAHFRGEAFYGAPLA